MPSIEPSSGKQGVEPVKLRGSGLNKILWQAVFCLLSTIVLEPSCHLLEASCLSEPSAGDSAVKKIEHWVNLNSPFGDNNNNNNTQSSGSKQGDKFVKSLGVQVERELF